MASLQLACRVYAINPEVLYEVKKLLLKTELGLPFKYGQYTEDGNSFDLSIVIKQRNENSYGYLLNIWIDQTGTIEDREIGRKVVRFYKEYDIQFLTEKEDFKDHLIVFGPKSIDSRLRKAIYFYVQETKDEFPDALRLLRVELKSNADTIMKHYPDLQHFCTEDNPDDRIRGVVIKGSQLEQTDVYERFVRDDETSGAINFLGITVEGGKLVYVGSDGSVYSRFYFKGEERIRVIYDLYSRFKKLNAFVNSLDNYNSST